MNARSKNLVEDIDRVEGAELTGLSEIATRNFMSRVRHDLMQPIAGMRLMTTHLVNDSGGNDSERLAEEFYKALDGLEVALNAMVDFEALLHLATPPAANRFNVGEAIDAAAAPLLERAEAAGLALNVAPADFDVTTDDALLAVAIKECLDNAIDFTFDGDIDVTAERHDDRLVIVIEDTGIGMQTASVDALSMPYVVDQAGASRRADRLGLGLARARAALDRLGGELALVNADPGVRVTIEIPLPRDD